MTAIFASFALMMSVLAQDAPIAPPVQQGEAQPAADPAASKSFDLARLKIDQCPGERFDFQASEDVKVGLCSKAGASNEEIAAMLESAIRQLEATDRMEAGARDAIVGQIRSKLAEVRDR